MKKAGKIIGIIAIAVVALAGYFIKTYNSIVTIEQNVDTQYSNVKVQLQRRADLIPNLVDTVKGYVAHEEKVIQDITSAREKMTNAGNIKELSEANEQLTAALNSLNVVVENYPDLKANQNFISLQDELSGTENRIATARRDYNEVVREYNTKISRFPTSIVAGIAGKDKKDLFDVTDSSKEDVPTVKFSE